MADTSYAALKPQYSQLWSTAALDVGIEAAVKRVVATIIAARARYEAAVRGSLLPWWVVGCLHYRESGNDFTTHLHNGDSLKRPTVNVPKGRPTPTGGPFTWEESAADALKFDGLLSIADTSTTYLLWRMELFNGKGYLLNQATRGFSPYLWAYTNHDDERGKYVSDGHYDPNAIEKQLGVVAIMLGLQQAGVQLFAPSAEATGKLVKEAITTVTTGGVGGAVGTTAATGNPWIGVAVFAVVAVVVAAGVWYALRQRNQG